MGAALQESPAGAGPQDASPGGRTNKGEAVGAARFIIVIQKIRQLRMQNTAIRLTILSAARSFEASARQPDFRILWNVSIFQRMAYHASFSTASLRERMGRFVISFQSIFSLHRGVDVSWA